MVDEFPVRIESFRAGNGYVGSSDVNHLEHTYMNYLEGWAVHITTGLFIYHDYVSGE